MIRLILYYVKLLFWELQPDKKIKAMQIRRFRAIFEYARQHSTFYRELYSDHNVMDLTIKSFADIEKIPIINKAILKKYKTEEIMTCDPTNDLLFHYTSGSTGEPFKLVVSKFENFTAHLRVFNVLLRYGFTPFKRMIYITRHGNDHSFNYENSSFGFILKILKLFPKKHLSIIDNPIHTMIDSIREYKPYLIWSNPSTLLLIAEELEKNDISLDIPLAVTLAESISEYEIRILRDRICKNLIDLYGSMELPTMAYSYNTVKYKTFITSSVLPEVINHRRFNESKVGDIIITNLVNKTMPFIRYELGDFVDVIEDKKFPNIKIGTVHGRYNDILKLDSTIYISYRHCYKMFSNITELEKYKLIQRPNNQLQLQIKVKYGFDKREVKDVLLKIWKEHFPDFPIEIEYKETFSVDQKTGKFKILEKVDY